MTRRLYDASSPPPDPHLDVCGFYIGGDTPHVWTDAEITGQSARWRLPIYTCDDPAQRNPSADAASAVAWLRSHHVPAGSALGLDYEMAKDPSYLTTFDGAVKAAGWTVLLYGSLSTVEQNPRPSAGYWTASWTGVPHLDPGAAATQYISDTQLGRGYDLSVVDDSLTLWDTQGAPTVEWTDNITGPNGRPGGNTVADILTDTGRLRDYLVGDPTAAAVYGPSTPLGEIVAAAQQVPGLVKQVQALQTAVSALATPQVDVAALAAALAPLLPKHLTVSGTETGTLT